MKEADLAKAIDHTLLKPEATLEDIRSLARETLAHGFASACFHPYFVPSIAREFPQLTICTVIGFPLGMNTEAVKLYEGQKAVEAGARELDLVINHAQVREGSYQEIAKELGNYRRIFADITLKLIIETSRLNPQQIIRLSEITGGEGFDFIKTSTGFSDAGATIEAVKLMKDNGRGAKVKASGGIRDRQTALAMIAAGADRIGTSSGILICSKPS